MERVKGMGLKRRGNEEWIKFPFFGERKCRVKAEAKRRRRRIILW